MRSKKFNLLVVGLFLLTLLAACGDNTATTAATSAATTAAATKDAGTNTGGDASIPTINGASTVDLPGMMKDQAGAFTANVKNGTFAAYKTADASSKVESSLSDSFKKAGWDDKSGMYAQAATALKSSGAFVLVFQKGNKVATVIGYPGQVASAMGANVGASDTFYMVISGEA